MIEVERIELEAGLPVDCIVNGGQIAPLCLWFRPRLLWVLLHQFGRIWTNLGPFRRHHSAFRRIVPAASNLPTSGMGLAD
jgi:hypothetical protein